MLKAGKFGTGYAPNTGWAEPSVARNIRILREELDIGSAELSRRIGKTGSYLSVIECGAAEPSIPSLILIARELGVHPSELLR